MVFLFCHYLCVNVVKLPADDGDCAFLPYRFMIYSIPSFKQQKMSLVSFGWTSLKRVSAICIKSHRCYNRAATNGRRTTSTQRVSAFTWKDLSVCFLLVGQGACSLRCLVQDTLNVPSRRRSHWPAGNGKCWRDMAQRSDTWNVWITLVVLWVWRMFPVCLNWSWTEDRRSFTQCVLFFSHCSVWPSLRPFPDLGEWGNKAGVFPRHQRHSTGASPLRGQLRVPGGGGQTHQAGLLP